MTDKVRYDWIDAAKAISILLVTMMHCTRLTEPLGIEAPLVEAANAPLSAVRMPLFFVVSGVFAASAVSRSWSDLLQRKVALFVWLLFIWSVVRFLFVSYVMPNPDNPLEGTRLAEIFEVFIEPKTGIWFLWSLAVFFVVTKMLKDTAPRIGAVVAVLVAGVANAEFAGVNATLAYAFDSLAYGNSLSYFAFFYVGCCFPQIIKAVGNARLLPSLFASWAAFLIILVGDDAASAMLIPGLDKLLKSIAGVTAMLFTARILMHLPIVSGLLEYIGQKTLAIYVAQVPVISVLSFVAVKLGADRMGVLENAVPVILTPVVVVMTLGVQMIAVRAKAGWLYELPKVPGARRGPTATPAA